MIDISPKFYAVPSPPLYMTLRPRSQTWLLLLCWCFTALRHFSGHFRHGQLTCPHCSRASLLMIVSLLVLSAHAFASNWQLPFLNQRKGENGHRNYFMTNLHERMLPDVRIQPTTVFIPGGHASDRATKNFYVKVFRTLFFPNPMTYLVHIWNDDRLLTQNVTQYHPQPSTWPKGQGHGLGIFMLQFYIKVFRTSLFSSSMMYLAHVWNDDRDWSKILCSFCIAFDGVDSYFA